MLTKISGIEHSPQTVTPGKSFPCTLSGTWRTSSTAYIAINDYNEKAQTPVIKPSGECWVVKSIELFLDDGVAEVWKVTDVNVAATEGAAREIATKLTHGLDDYELALKRVYTVEPRWVEL